MAENDDKNYASHRCIMVEACACYLKTYGLPINALSMTPDLAIVFADHLKEAGLHWAIGSISRYSRFLKSVLEEELPDIEDDVISDATVYRYNFLSMVAQLVNEQLLPKLNAIPKDESKSVAEPKSPPPTPVAITPKKKPNGNSESSINGVADLLAGFKLRIEPNAPLDADVPICARDQHLLFNVFGDKWKDFSVIGAYIKLKGQTAVPLSAIPTENNNNRNDFKF